jgi:hypothetical protein
LRGDIGVIAFSIGKGRFCDIPTIKTVQQHTKGSVKIYARGKQVHTGVDILDRNRKAEAGGAEKAFAAQIDVAVFQPDAYSVQREFNTGSYCPPVPRLIERECISSSRIAA